MNILTLDDLPGKGIRLSRTTLWRLERDGIFPRRIQISPGRVGWLESEVDRYVAERAEHHRVVCGSIGAIAA